MTDFCTVSFDPTGKIISSHARHLRVWDLATDASSLVIMEGHPFDSVAFSPDGQYVLSSSIHWMAEVWHVESGDHIHSLEGHLDGLRQALFSPDGNYIATASIDKTVRLWRADDGSCLATFADHGGQVDHIVFSPDGKRLASGDGGGIVRICDISHITGQ